MGVLALALLAAPEAGRQPALAVTHVARSLQPGEVVLLRVTSGQELSAVTGRAFGRDTMEQAEKRQAVLLSLGIESKIEHVVRSDETLYRVRLRPIGTLAEFEQVKTKLAEASIDFEGVGDVSVAPPP